MSRAVLFGSRANGTSTDDSDVDLIMEFSKPITLITLSLITERLEEILKTDVDVIHGPIQSTDMIEIDKEIEV
ncbi:MAG: nucleotidyltransferase domain-containing protein [Ruminiclostridium sp.]|nr:nucleotidyltransferase domain-containing protein [Ruminiclostridium sp.]